MRQTISSFVLNESERRQLERLARRYSMTLTEVCMQVRQELLAAFDPSPGEGEPVEFTSPNLLGPNYFAGRNVPTPDANVDFFEAWDQAVSDAEIGRYLLDTYPSREVAISVHGNGTAWCRFWAVRFPDPDRRQRFAELAAARETEMQRWLSVRPAERRLRVVKGGA
jgi:hypothetical protein